MSEVVKLRIPEESEKLATLKAGTIVSLSGTIITGRDKVHHHLIHDATKESFPISLEGQVIYHCGPIVKKTDEGEWEVVVAGPTTSAREEPFQGDVMRRYGVRGVIGKGGMGKKTADALCEVGGAYLAAIGGAAVVLAKAIERVEDVYFLDEFGMPEAMWVLSIKNFPAVITMDAFGNSLHNDIDIASKNKLRELLD